jgi:hypothetical protein
MSIMAESRPWRRGRPQMSMVIHSQAQAIDTKRLLPGIMSQEKAKLSNMCMTKELA